MSNVVDWTEGRYRSFITSTIRGGFRRYPPKFQVLKNAFISKKINKKTGRLASHYKCAKCKKGYVATDVQVDHIDPVVDPAVGFVSWDVFIDRLFCKADNLQVLCKPCHAIKTKLERKKK
jgi:5-methylcytosine-specific restriction endonuclease McrA